MAVRQLQHLTSIEYTGADYTAPQHKVEFIYQERKDKWTGTVGKLPQAQTALVEKINVISNRHLIWSYKLDYQLLNSVSALMSITKQDAGGTQLNSTEFLWEKPRINFLDTVSAGLAIVGYSTDKCFQGDFNGDGTADILSLNFSSRMSPNESKCFINYGTPDGFVRSGWLDLPRARVFSAKEEELNNYGYEWRYIIRDKLSDIKKILVGDFDGDGITDMLVYIQEYKFKPRTGSNIQYFSKMIEPDGLYCRIYSLKDGSIILKHEIAADFAPESFCFDFDSDGRTEIMHPNASIYQLQGNSFVRIDAGKANKYSSELEKGVWGDFNSDGLMDYADAAGAVYLRDYNNYTFTQHSSPESGKRLLGTTDTNNDGTPGLIFLDAEPYVDEKFLMLPSYSFHNDVYSYRSSGYYVAVYFDKEKKYEYTGSNFYYDEYGTEHYMGNYMYVYAHKEFGHPLYITDARHNLLRSLGWVSSGTAFTHAVSADFNVDGKQDIAFFYNNTLKAIWYRTAWGYEADHKNLHLGRHYFGDYTGTGNTCILSIDNKRIYSFVEGSPQTRIHAIRDGLGVKSRISYKPLTDRSVYTKGSRAVYPMVDFAGPLWVVSRIEQDNGSVDDLAASYTYEGAKAHTQGRGLLGFAKLTVNNTTTGVVTRTETTFDPAYGVPSSVSITSTLNQTVSKVEKTYFTILPVDNARKRFLQYVSSSYEIDTKGNIVTRNYEIDSYANIIKETVSYGGGVSAENCFDYTMVDNDSAYICLLDSQTVKNTRGGRSVMQKTAYTYNNYLPAAKSIYYNSSHVSTEVYAYDNRNFLSEIKTKIYESDSWNTVRYEYDNFGRVSKETDPMGLSTRYRYDEKGLLVSITDARGNTTGCSYGPFRKKIKTAYPGGTTVENTCCWTRSAGRKEGLYYVIAASSGQPVVKTYYDAAGREVRTSQTRFDGSELKTYTEYTNSGQKARVSLPSAGAPNLWNEYHYYASGRPLRVVYASGRRDEYQYSGNSVTSTQSGIRSTKKYDASGALLSVSDPGGTITYHLRPDGQPDSITAPGNIVTRFRYDKYGRQTHIDDPSAGVQVYGYDAAGNINYQRDANGKTVVLTYDRCGRLTRKTYPEFTAAYSYNAYGDIVTETSSNSTSRTFTYDRLGRLQAEKETVPDGKFLEKTYAYNPDGNLQSVSYKSHAGSITSEHYTYQNGHLKEIKLNGSTSIWKLLGENKLGQPAEVATGAVIRQYDYDAYGLPAERKAHALGYEFFHQAYHFSPQTSNLLSREDITNRKTESFTYDALNRLVKKDNNDYVDYQGNTGSIHSIAGVGSFAYEFSRSPYAVSAINTETAAGLVQHGADDAISYTSFSRPERIESGNKTTQFTYNTSGERVKTIYTVGTSTRQIRYYIGGQYEAASGTDNKEILYLGGDAYSAPAVYVKQGSRQDIYYICRDYLGSICAVTNSGGSVVEVNSYDPWGRRRNPETHELYAAGSGPALFLNRGFTGHEHMPEYGYINMNARLYDPVIGRFLSPDPYVQAPDFSQAFNRYSYALNNPLKYVDENGEFVWLAFALYAAWNMGLNAGFAAEEAGGHFWKDGFWKGALIGFGTGALSNIAPFGTEWLGSTAWGALVGTASQAGAIWSTGGKGKDFQKIWQGALLGAASGFAGSQEFSNMTKGKGFNTHDQVLKNFKDGKYGVKEGSTWQQDVLDYFGFEGKYMPGEYDNDAWFSAKKGIGYSDGAFSSYDNLKRSYIKETFEKNSYLNATRIKPDNPTGIWDVDRWSQELAGHIYEYKNTGLYPKAAPSSLLSINNSSKMMRFYNQAFEYDIFKNPTYEAKWWHFIYKIPRRF